MKIKLYKWVKFLSLVGITLALYLLYEQYTLPANPICTINSTVNCDAIISGAVAKTFGIPTPLYGLIGYLVIFIAAVKRNSKLILGMAAFGLVFCLYIAYREIVGLRVICPVCIACQIDMISVFVLGIFLNQASPPDSKQGS